MKDKRRFQQAEKEPSGGTEGCGKDNGLFGDCKELLLTEQRIVFCVIGEVGKTWVMNDTESHAQDLVGSRGGTLSTSGTWFLIIWMPTV